MDPSKLRCAAVRKGRYRRRGIRRSGWRRTRMRMSCRGPPFQCGDQTIGPDRDLGEPDPSRVANGIGEGRRRRDSCDLADTNAAAEHMVEATFVKVHID